MLDEKFQISEEDVENYYKLNERKKEIEKQIKQLNERFHHYFDKIAGENQKGEIQVGHYKIQRQIRQAHFYEEEKTVERLETLNLHDCIQVIKKPNDKKIESAITLGIIDRKQIDDCKMTKKTKAIVVKKI